MLRSLLSLFTFFVLFGSVNTQGVLISGQAGVPDPSALLELRDTSSGFLPPRLTTQQRNTIVSPAVGLAIFNSDNQCFEGYFQSGWTTIACECQVAPAVPSQVSGPTQVCPQQATSTYSVSSVLGAQSYTWQVPAGATILSGQGSLSITVSWGTVGGNIEVSALNACGQSSFFAYPVVVTPASASFTASPTSGSVGSPVQFTPAQTGGSYAWTFQSGSIGNSIAQSPSVTWSSIGNYSVSLVYTSPIGCVDSSQISLSIINCIPLQGQSQTFTFTGGVQNFTVPAGVCSLQVDVRGAQGGYSSNGGRGGRVQATIPVTPGEVLGIYVGGAGTQTGTSAGATGGWNGGGNSQASAHTPSFGSGGGGSDMRRGGSTLSDRVVVAGGGGGSYSTSIGGAGGAGGGLTGGNGGNDCSVPGFGGTQSAGGAGGGINGCGCSGSPQPGNPGSLGQGGHAPTSCCFSGAGCNGGAISAGGGGGGYFGGGSGGTYSAGGGGSSYTAPTSTSVSHTQGFQTDNGQITLSW
jgi:PKD repeat protein